MQVDGLGAMTGLWLGESAYRNGPDALAQLIVDTARAAAIVALDRQTFPLKEFNDRLRACSKRRSPDMTEAPYSQSLQPTSDGGIASPGAGWIEHSREGLQGAVATPWRRGQSGARLLECVPRQHGPSARTLAKVGDTAGEDAGGVFGVPVGDDPVHRIPGGVISIGPLLAAADGDDLMSGQY